MLEAEEPRAILRAGEIGIMEKNQIQKEIFSRHGGFTLIEILVVVIILGLAMYAAVPMFSGAASMQVQSAANMVVADLEYAKSMAISRQQNYGVVFDTGANKYQVVVDQNGVDVVVPHPVKLGFQYIIDFRADSRLSQVTLTTANFDSTNKIMFNYLGSPFNGTGTDMNSGTITMQAGGVTMTITIEPVTGYIRIQ